MPESTEVGIEGEPTILYFRAVISETTYYPDPERVAFPATLGDTIRFEWATEALTTTFMHPSAGFHVAVDNIGSFVYRVRSTDTECLGFSLLASNGDLIPQSSASLFFALPCSHALFFQPEPQYGNGCWPGCPSAPMISAAAEQHFEHGTMIWIKEWDEVRVLFSDEAVERDSARYPDRWSEDTPGHCPSPISPNKGRYRPVNRFGLIWCETPGVRKRLGWAIDQETTFTTTVQTYHRTFSGNIYIRSLDGDIWHLQTDDGIYHWSEWEQ